MSIPGAFAIFLILMIVFIGIDKQMSGKSIGKTHSEQLQKNPLVRVKPYVRAIEIAALMTGIIALIVKYI